MNRAPWTRKQVANLDRWQNAAHVHPFTCGGDGCREVLVPTTDGWVCSKCDYTQGWAHDFMLAGPPSDFLARLRDGA